MLFINRDKFKGSGFAFKLKPHLIKDLGLLIILSTQSLHKNGNFIAYRKTVGMHETLIVKIVFPRSHIQIQ